MLMEMYWNGKTCDNSTELTLSYICIMYDVAVSNLVEYPLLCRCISNEMHLEKHVSYVPGAGVYECWGFICPCFWDIHNFCHNVSQTDFIFSAQSFEKFNLSNIRLTLSGQFPIFGIYWQNIIPNKKETVDREVCGLSRMNRTCFFGRRLICWLFCCTGHSKKSTIFQKKKK